jgi:hypothetical protein
MPYLKSKAMQVVEGVGYLLEGAVAVGLVSSTAVAVAMGKFLLAGALGAAFIGILLRLKRGRLARRARQNPLP